MKQYDVVQLARIFTESSFGVLDVLVQKCIFVRLDGSENQAIAVFDTYYRDN